jgi:hydroxymethylpyrimidine/phosphomethylpyrimidine kinase
VKGGHLVGDPVDKWFDGRKILSLTSQRFDTRHTHGTGCTFSAAITAGLAKRMPLDQVIPMAKGYITSAIREELGIGIGHGPTNHWAYADEMSEQMASAEYMASLTEHGDKI